MLGAVPALARGRSRRWLGTRRLQPQLRWIVAVRGRRRAAGRRAGAGLTPRELLRRSSAVSTWRLRSSGRSARPARSAPRWQAKFHRLAALVLAGGAGLVTCITFVWFSAPDLALTQLLVEIVTTVLLLLGLRWLPKRIPFACDVGRRARGACRARAARPRARDRRGRRPRGARLRGDDAAAARTASRASSWSAPIPRAAAPTSST